MYNLNSVLVLTAGIRSLDLNYNSTKNHTKKQQLENTYNENLFRRVKMADNLSIEWWKNAAKDCPVAVAFVDENDKFLYVNQEWSILTGYAPAQLVGQKTWQEITTQEDIGGDAAAIRDIKSGKSIEYYMEKKYVRADGSQVSVGIYVHRQPPYGKHQGYIIFAKQVGSKEMAALQVSFENLKNNITVLEHISRGFERIDERVKAQYDKIDSLEEIVSAIVASNNKSSDSHINIGGDVTGQDKTGRDKNSMWIVAMGVLCVIILGALVFDKYLSVSKDKIEVNQTELINKSDK